MTYRLLAALALLLFAAPALAHEGESHDHSQDAAADGPASPVAMVLPAVEGPKPWSDKPVLNAEDRFQIAIVTDRTGGHRPGVWMEAMRKLNLLRPEFVMSVGDLIEGYTQDRAQLEKEWAEFLGFVDHLDMRFFFVPGNHDVINPTQTELWKEKFGKDYFSFDYRGVHFVCLNSEDIRNQIGPEQLEWLRGDLEANKDARWTLVFVHKPLWTYSERARNAGNPDDTNWKPVEQMLADRPHTVFAGHVHHYVQYQRNGGRQYYSLATTGGGSQLRGNQYGEFDHVMWLTMEADGPHLAVLRLDGILPPGVVTEESADRFRRFLERARVEVAPILVENEQGFAGGDLHVRLVNELGEEVQATCQIDGLPLDGLTVDQPSTALRVGPTGTAEQSVRVQFNDPIDFSRLRGATLTATITTTGDNPLRAERLLPVVIDQRHRCPLVAEAPVIDGVTEPWPAADYATPEQPLLLDSITSWKAPSDASFRFHASHDAENLYFAVRVTDERVAAGDKLRLIVDGRPLDQRRESPRLRWGVAYVDVEPPVNGDPNAFTGKAYLGGRRPFPLDAAQLAARQTDAGYDVEVALPKRVVTRGQGEDWHSFQLAIEQHDVDEEGGDSVRVLWRGSPEIDETNAGFGHFVRTAGE